jgi:hypothetical protein
MPEEHSDATATAGDSAVPPEDPATSTPKRGEGEKAPKSYGKRALASLRAAKRGQVDVADPVERAQLLLAEANVLALLELAQALGEHSDDTK